MNDKKKNEPTIHLMHGYMGVGKTTIAKKLADELSAVRLSFDDFMTTLYPNPPYEFFNEYFKRIDKLIWNIAEKIVNAGADVIYDSCLLSKQDRANAFENASKITDNVIFYYVKCDMKTAEKRVIARTISDEKGEEMVINESNFYLPLPQFEPISESEGYKIVVFENS